MRKMALASALLKHKDSLKSDMMRKRSRMEKMLTQQVQVAIQNNHHNNITFPIIDNNSRPLLPLMIKINFISRSRRVAGRSVRSSERVENCRGTETRSDTKTQTASKQFAFHHCCRLKTTSQVFREGACLSPS